MKMSFQVNLKMRGGRAGDRPGPRPPGPVAVHRSELIQEQNREQMNLNDVHPCLLPVHVSRPAARAQAAAAPRAAAPRDQPRARPDLPCPPAAPRPPLARPSGYALSGGSAGCALSLTVRWSAWCAAGAPAAACRAQPKTADHAKSEQDYSGRITNIARPNARLAYGTPHQAPSLPVSMLLLRAPAPLRWSVPIFHTHVWPSSCVVLSCRDSRLCASLTQPMPSPAG